MCMCEFMVVQENVQECFDYFIDLIVEEVGWDVCFIYLFRKFSLFEFCVMYGLKLEFVYKVCLKLGEGFVGFVVCNV